mgnify:CR=1 FL=1
MAEGYAHPEFLVETEWLAAHLDEPHLRVVDCDERPAYLRAHLPGAVGLPNNRLKAHDDAVHLMPAAEFQEVMESLGVSDDTLVVAYDGTNGLWAARLWWALQVYGHDNVRVLDGGWRKWLAEGRPITTRVPRYPRGSFTPRERREHLATLEDVRARLGRPDVALWDTRHESEFRGENSRGNRRPGRLEGAVHLEWLEAVDPETGVLRPAAELRRMLEERGITPEKEVVTY